ncbi:E3 ubiquitin-protein ligase XB3 [Hordeum vulgare]|nr:E3 ubiquitin-protein ligase XB3 [Hordeum vulgare]
MGGSVRRDSIASTRRVLGFSWAGSSKSRRADPSTRPMDFKSHQEWAARHGKERIRIVEAYLVEEMAEADVADAAERAAAEEEAIRARVLKKRQRRNPRALAREQNRVIHEMVGMPPKEKEGSDDEDISSDKQSRLDPYCIFDRFFHGARAPGRARLVVDDLYQPNMSNFGSPMAC